MTKTSTLTIRLDPQLKQDTEKVLDDLGLTTTQAVTLFLKQVSLQKGLPFSVAMPNAETLKAMSDVVNRRNLKTFESVDALFAELET
ncbi:MAG: type II toxin-antitoxin system RelB/DinJ family antitoxin [Anaerolineales bacterium]|nr:type II toxin-antitoxin system RelB/DinJ family antitoxin [Anaerolineales bacterium]